MTSWETIKALVYTELDLADKCHVVAREIEEHRAVIGAFCQDMPPELHNRWLLVSRRLICRFYKDEDGYNMKVEPLTLPDFLSDEIPDAEQGGDE